jgi:glycolate oxidase FAD binding subunit
MTIPSEPTAPSEPALPAALPPALQQMREQVLTAAAAGKPLQIRGSGSKSWYGQAVGGELLETGAWSGIVAYEPTELVITARGGTPLREIEAALAMHNQMLAFEPPCFGPDATWGGMIASGLSGPRRAVSGALRDFVLGAMLLDGKGDILTFGGQVMKNVAGYDVSRLLAGSMGTLGVILEASLKVLPQPRARATLRFMLSQHEAIKRLNEWGGQPLPLAASAWTDGMLMLRLEGAEAAVKAACQKLKGEPVLNAEAFWIAVREQTHEFFRPVTDPATPRVSLWRLSLPPTAAVLDVPGPQLIEWGGALRWLRVASSNDADFNRNASKIRTAVSQAGGTACLFRGGDKRVGVFHPLAPAVARINRNLKQAFDPAEIFNRGRM